MGGAEVPDPEDGRSVTLGPIVVEAVTPWWVSLIWGIVYYGTALAAAFVVGFFGPFDGWAALLAAIFAGVLGFLVVFVLMFIGMNVWVLFHVRRDRRAFDRDPRAFMNRKLHRHEIGGSSAPTGRWNREPRVNAIGTVRWFDQEEGWGVIDSEQTPGGAFVGFPDIEMEGFRWLEPGQSVTFVAVDLSPRDQDGYCWRAERVRMTPS